MGNKKRRRIWVNEDFALKLKQDAAASGKGLIEYTEGLVCDDQCKIKPKRIKKGGFLDDFKF